MDYHGTDDNDTLDQTKLKLPDWSTLYGGKGDDTITIGAAQADGGAGNDTIIGTSTASTVVFWSSPKGVVVNLATGIAEDGHGSIDTLVNIRVVQGTGFDDQFIGSDAAEEFWWTGGDDVFIGGREDTVVFWDKRYEDANVVYDAFSDTFTVKLVSGSGDVNTNTLVNIGTISFNTPTYQFSLTQYDIGDFSKTYTSNVINTPGAFAASVKSGDFNKDGYGDILIVQQVGSGKAAVPNLIYTGDGTGKFTDATSNVFTNGAGISNPGGGRTLVADYNNDGISDIFQLGFGDDSPPFPGGLNQLFLSSSGRIVDASSSLQQNTQLNHGGSLGDINGDGFLDILVNSLKDGNFLHVNDGTGHFVNRSEWLPHPAMPGSTQAQTNTYSGIVDLNGDHFADIILGKWDGSSSILNSQILLNDSTGKFITSTPIALPTSGVYREIVLDVKPIDLNGDSLPDLALSITSGREANTVGESSETYYKTPYVQLLINEGNGIFRDETAKRLPQPLAANSNWYIQIEVADFNRDGHTDILASSAGVISSVVYMNNGDGTFKEYWRSPLDSKTVAQDVNNDGMLDLVTYKDGANPSLSVNQNSLLNQHIYKANFGGESLLGSDGNDLFYTRDSSNKLDGAAGIDVAMYSKAISAYQIARTSADGVTVVGAGISDSLLNIERLRFTDKNLAFDLQGNAGKVAKILGAVFGKESTSNSKYVGIGLHYLDNGMGYEDLLDLAINAKLGPDTTSTRIVDLLYKNITGKSPDPVTLSYFVSILEGGEKSIGELGLLASEHPLNLENIHLVGLMETGIAFIPFA